MNQATTTASARVFFNKYGGNTEKQCCDINFSYLPALYHASFRYCDAKFAYRVYKEAYEYRSPSVVALNANCNRKTARQEASEKKALLEHGISLKCQYILFDMSASQHSPPFVPFCIPEQRLIPTQLMARYFGHALDHNHMR